jgi:hypothetical protein
MELIEVSDDRNNVKGVNPSPISVENFVKQIKVCNVN